MTRSRKVLACLLGGLLLPTAAAPLWAASAENPYQDIVERNVFSLKPPPPPPSLEPPKPPAPKLKLTGLITFWGKKQALITVPPAPATKPGEQPKEQFYTLPVGLMVDDIKVLEIDEKRGLAKVDNHGNEELLYLPTNAVPAMAAGPAGGAVPGFMPPGGFSNPNAMPASIANPYGSGGVKTIPNRIMRTPQSGYTPSGSSSGYASTLNPAGAGAATANYGARYGFAAPQTPQTASPVSNLTPDQQEAALLIQHTYMKGKGDPAASIMPVRENLAPNPAAVDPNTGGGAAPPNPLLPPRAPTLPRVPTQQ